MGHSLARQIACADGPAAPVARSLHRTARDRDIAANVGHGESSRRPPSILRRGVLAALALGRRAAAKPYQLRLMAPPAFLEAGDVQPFSDPGLVTACGDPRIPYATLREPAHAAARDPFYSSLR